MIVASRRRGFSLLEIMVCLVIMAAAATVAVPAYRRTGAAGPDVRLKEELGALFRQCRTEARKRGHLIQLVVEPAGDRAWLIDATERGTPPSMVTLSPLLNSAWVRRPDFRPIVCASNGSIAQDTVLLKVNDSHLTIDVRGTSGTTR